MSERTIQDKLDISCLFLIKTVSESGADKAKITHENVTNQGENIGTWRITIEKLDKFDHP